MLLYMNIHEYETVLTKYPTVDPGSTATPAAATAATVVVAAAPVAVYQAPGITHGLKFCSSL